MEEKVVRDLCGRLWASDDADLGLESPLGQAELLRLLTPLHRDRLHRTLARALLYSGGYEDTRVVTSTVRSVKPSDACKYISVQSSHTSNNKLKESSRGAHREHTESTYTLQESTQESTEESKH